MFSFVIKNAFAIFLKFFLLATPVFKTMKVNFYTEAMERPDFIKKIEHTAVIGRVRNIEANDMKMFICQVK